MSDFEFFVSFYGLLLGLSLAEVATKFADAIGARRRRPLGLMTPALAVFVLFDISSFWILAWDCRFSIRMNWETVFGGLLIALIYYLSAALVFPRSPEEWTSLNEYYWHEKRFVLGGIGIANLMSLIVLITLLKVPFNEILGSQVAYWLPFTILYFSQNRRWNLAMMGCLLGNYAVTAAVTGQTPDTFIAPAAGSSHR